MSSVSSSSRTSVKLSSIVLVVSFSATKEIWNGSANRKLHLKTCFEFFSSFFSCSKISAVVLLSESCSGLASILWWSCF